jgi:hypothetical protein
MIERPATPGPEPATPGAAPAASPTAAAQRLQILATEHWSLLATRSMTWNESFSRASMFLSVLSGAIVALALVAQAADFRGSFLAFAIPLLSVVLFVGIATFVRLSAINNEDSHWVAGMNRLRHAYLEIEPDLDRYFITASHDDARGALITMGWDPGSGSATTPTFGNILHGLSTVPGMLAVVVGVVGGALAAVVALAIGASEVVALIASIVGFVVTAALLAYRGYLEFVALHRNLRPEFPSPEPPVARDSPDVS